MTVHKLNLDLSKNEVVNEPIYLRQGDKNTQTIEATITDNMQPASLSGLSAKVVVTKPDGYVVDQDAAVNGNVVTAQVAEEASQTVGKMYGYVKLVNSAGDEVNSTNSFKMVVLKAANVNISSQPYIQSAEELIHTLKQNVDQFQAGASDQIATIQASLQSLQKQVDTSAQTATDNAIAKLQNEINGVEKSLQDQIKTATDDAAKQALETVQSTLNNLVQSATTAQETAVKQINSLTQQATDTLGVINKAKADSDNALKALLNNQSSSQDALDKITAIQSNAQKALDDLNQKIASSTVAANAYVSQTQESAQQAIALIDDINKNKQASLDTYNQSLTDNLNSAKDKLTAALNKVAVDGKTAIDNFDTAGNKAIQKIQSDFDDLKKQNASIDLSKFVTSDELAAKTSGAIVTAYDIANKHPTTETNSYTNGELVDQGVLGQFADQINQLKGRRAVDAPDFNALTDTGVYFISNPKGGNNYPATNWGTLVVFAGSQGTNARTAQIYAADNCTDAFMRIYGNINGDALAWGSWHQIAWKSDLTGYAKTVSLNGGDKAAPDSGGNIDLAVPQPDLSGYAKTADVNGQFTTVNNQIKELQSQQSTFTPITQAAYNNLTDTQKNNGMYAIIG